MPETASSAVQDSARNIALFVDYENVYKALLPDCRNVIRDGFFEKIRRWCDIHGGRIVKLAVYCNFDNTDLHESFHQSLLQSYGVETIHTSNQGKNYADMQIAIDALNAMYLNSNIDEFMIMSNDKDMTPLLNTIRLNKRKATVMTIGPLFNPAIRMFADDHVAYETIVTSVSDVPLIVGSIEQNIWEDTNRYLSGKCAEWLGRKEVPTFGIDIFLSTQTPYYNLMRYEVANILGSFARQRHIVFHKYPFKGIIYEGFRPESYQDAFLSAGLLRPEMLLTDYDIEGFVAQQYHRYQF